MKFSHLTHRISGKSETHHSSDHGSENTATHSAGTRDAWEIHNRAMMMQRAGESVIVLSIGQEADELTPPLIVDAATDSLKSGRHHYTHVEGDPDLRSAIARYHRQMTGQQVEPTQCIVHSGAQNALFSVAQCLLETGDEVIMPEPYYTTYPGTFTATGATAVPLTVDASTGFKLTTQTVLDAITPATQALVLNSPSNPLGALYSRADLEPVIEACISNDIWMISDEVYAALVSPEKRFSPAAITRAQHLTVTVSSLSKSHRMTGWRVGWSVSPQPLADHIGELSMCMHYGLPPFIMDAAVAALADDSVSATVRAAIADRRRIVHDNLNAGKALTIFDSGEGMFVLLDVSGSGRTAFEFAAGLLESKQVSALPCDGFGPSGNYLLRVGLCVDGDQLSTACQRISEYANNL